MRVWNALQSLADAQASLRDHFATLAASVGELRMSTNAGVVRSLDAYEVIAPLESNHFSVSCCGRRLDFRMVLGLGDRDVPRCTVICEEPAAHPMAPPCQVTRFSFDRIGRITETPIEGLKPGARIC